MSAEPNPTCRDLLDELDGFVDGELDRGSMRRLADHVAGCTSCEGEVRGVEHLRGALRSAIAAEVESVDAGDLWRSIEAGIEAPALAAAARLPSARRGWTSAGFGWRLPALAVAAAAVALVVAVLRSEPATNPATRVANNHARIDRIESSSPHVMMWSEPEEHTTAIWVASYEP